MGDLNFFVRKLQSQLQSQAKSMNLYRYGVSAAASLAGFAALTGSAHAAGVDYGALEELFNEPVTTSATGAPQRASEAPASMTIISGEDLRRSGARTIPDILQNFAGIDVNRYATMQRDVTIRGGNMPYSPRLLVLVNGRQVFLDHYGYTDWQLIGVEYSEIQQVEIIRGPNSALFGFNAVAGVVNIVTKSAIGAPEVAGRVEYGEDDVSVASIAGRLKLSENVGVRLSAGFEQQKEWDDLEDAWIASTGSVDDPQRQNYSAEISANLTPKTQATASYTFAEAEQIQQSYAYNLNDFISTLQSVNGAIVSETGLGLVRAQAYYNWFEQETASGGTGLSVAGDVLAVKFEDLFKPAPAHTVRLSGEYRRSEYTFQDEANGEVFFDVYAVGAMWDWAVNPMFTLTNAVRVDQMNIGHDSRIASFNLLTKEDYEEDHTVVSFNSSIVAKLDENSSLRLSAARGIQVPSLNALGIALNFGGVLISGDPTLEPSITESVELAFNRRLPHIHGGFDAALAYTQIKDFLAASQNSDIQFGPGGVLIFKEAKLGDFDTVSFETNLHGQVDSHWGWQMNYTWTDVSEDLVSAAVNASIPLAEGTPEHKFNAVVDYSSDDWDAFVAARYRSDTEQRLPTPFGSGVASFVERDADITLDARVARRLANDVSVWAAVENLTDSEAAGLSAYDASRAFRVGIGYQY